MLTNPFITILHQSLQCLVDGILTLVMHVYYSLNIKILYSVSVQFLT